ncbi:ABC transporter ATP-binding protein [Bosea sp. 2KB_26]|uniref:ABC transporter ATP-binding protein n=1 Tax=Bosea sp. 2KB_26 TaxID=3237475 RepID=UPI003F933BE0
MTSPLLQLRNLRVSYDAPLRNGVAVGGLDLEVERGETLALVGESGCGKSTTALSVLGLLPAHTEISGQILFDGGDLVGMAPERLRALRGRQIGMIFQEPMTSLNPVYTIGRQIAEVLHEHTDISAAAARRRVLELLEQVGIPDPAHRIDAYPHELSGGQRQRAMIAMAIALRPRLLIADEPTTALDSTTQMQILELIDGLRRELGMSVLLISHDLPLVRAWSDRVVVMHHGQKMETLKSRDLFEAGRHPYTRGLISASIRLSDERHYTTSRLAEVRAHRAANDEFRFELHTPPGRIAATASAPDLPGPDAAGPDASAALDVRDLTVRYPGADRPAVDGVSFTLARNQTLGLVGESGSGKSSLSRAIMRLIPGATGEISLLGKDLAGAQGAGLRQARRHIQMVFQDPYASLNPRQTVGDILGNPLKLHGIAERGERVRQMLDRVGLPASSVDRYPHEFSGGQRQRIGIARALILQPDVLICDEPVSALDVSIQAQILNLLADIRAEFGLSMLFISHDLAVVQYVSDKVMVMQGGKIVDTGDHTTIWRSPRHPYTKALIAAVN